METVLHTHVPFFDLTETVFRQMYKFIDLNFWIEIDDGIYTRSSCLSISLFLLLFF